MKYQSRVLDMVLLPEGKRVFDEGVTNVEITNVEITDGGAGEFLTVIQQTVDGQQEIKIDLEEWPHLKEMIDLMISNCE